MRILLFSILSATLILSGCAFKRPKLPRVHKLTVQQGNVITQTMIDKLKPGMTRSQVAFIMGDPVVKNSFNEKRWDYVYSIELPGVFSNVQMVSIFFVDDQLAYFTGDLVPTRVTETASAEQTADEGLNEGLDEAVDAEAGTESPADQSD